MTHYLEWMSNEINGSNKPDVTRPEPEIRPETTTTTTTTTTSTTTTTTTPAPIRKKVKSTGVFCAGDFKLLRCDHDMIIHIVAATYALDTEGACARL